jgi:hypothetical protein
MLTAKFTSLAIALAIASVVASRTIKRDFQPPLRSHVELFLVGVPIGFLGMFIVMPGRPYTVWLAIACGLLVGIGSSFSLPRQWRYELDREGTLFRER